MGSQLQSQPSARGGVFAFARRNGLGDWDDEEDQVDGIRQQSIDMATREVPCVEVADLDSSSTEGDDEETPTPPTPPSARTPPLSPSFRRARLASGDHEIHHGFSWRKLWAFTGPGLIMSVAFLDPGNLESDLQTGSETGYDLLWVLAWSTALGLCFQLLSVRIGVVTGKGLAEACHDCMPRHMRIILWILIEIAIIGSGVQEVMGCAIAISVVSDGAVPLWLGALLTASDSFMFLLLEGAGIRYLEGFFGMLIGMMVVTFGVMFGQAAPPAGEILRGIFVPKINGSTLGVAVGLVGSIVMPHNVFLHSALVQSRKINRSSDMRVREANMYFGIESSVSLLVSFVVNMFVVTVFAKDFRVAEGTEIGISNAGEVITTQYPQYLKYIWGVGLLAAGQSSTMTGTYAGQFVMQGFLKLHLRPWQRVMLTRCVALVPSLALALFFSSDDQLNQSSDWLNVLQSIQLPFAMIPCVVLASSPKLMGVHATSRFTHAATWLLLLGVVTGNAYLCVQFMVSAVAGSVLATAAFWTAAAGYVGLVGYIAFSLELHHDNRLAVRVHAVARDAWERCRADGPLRRRSSVKEPLLRAGEGEEANGASANGLGADDARG
mmetsp:Transcript_2323/g.4699  ORF Transcript_2323/g.4699 Transcript_2323/m.4699 type:complete len:607 (-) Transcript_2323:45-1865(-)